MTSVTIDRGHGLSITIDDEKPTRRCGDCQLCCKLLPVPELHKPAGKRCRHQRHHKGCAIYPRRPSACATWSCRWLVNNDTADLGRPDRTHYVIDVSPDFVSIRDNKSGKIVSRLQVVQIWLDPDFPNAHRDPALRAYLERRAAEGIAALVRLDDKRAFPLIAPALNEAGMWYEESAHTVAEEKTHTAAEIVQALRDDAEPSAPLAEASLAASPTWNQIFKSRG